MTADNGVWVYVETNDGAAESVGLEMLGKARDLAESLGTTVTALQVGTEADLEGLGAEAVAHGADRVLQVTDDRLDTYRPETYAAAVEGVIEEVRPSVLLVGATHDGIDLAGRLAVRLDVGLTADVTRLEIDDDGSLVGGVPAFAGGILAMVKSPGSRPQMSTVRPGVFDALDPDPDREGDIERVAPDLPDEVVTEVLERSVGESVDLPSADVVVAFGRGSDGDLDLARDLADRLDATLGVTRPLCDEGILPRDHQIGTTGASLKADLAIVAGVSGAIHFTAGTEDCDTVVAINTDPEAQIFEHADYCVEGDLFEVLPALLDELGSTQEVAP